MDRHAGQLGPESEARRFPCTLELVYTFRCSSFAVTYMAI